MGKNYNFKIKKTNSFLDQYYIVDEGEKKFLISKF